MIRAHKVLAAYACLVPRIVTGRFDPTTQRAVWPSTGNYCRGGVAISRILGCHGVAVLPEGMSRGAVRLAADVGDVAGRHRHHARHREQRPGDLRGVRRAGPRPRERDHQPVLGVREPPGALAVHRPGARAPSSSTCARPTPDLRLRAFVSASGSAGTLGAGDHLKEAYGAAVVAVEALECPTMLRNGFGSHNIQGIGDKHIPLIHHVHNTDVVVAVTDRATDQLSVLFSDPVGLAYLADRRGVPEATLAALPSFGLSSICNVLAAVKLAKHLDLGPDDVVVTVATDGAELYDSERQRIRARDFADGFDEASGGRGVRALDARRRHQRPARDDDARPGPDLRPRLLHLGRAARHLDRGLRRPPGPGVLGRAARPARGVGRADRRLQRPHRRLAERAGERGRPPADWSAGAAAPRRGPHDPYPFRCPDAGVGDVDHVLVRVLDLDRVHFPTGLAGAGVAVRALPRAAAQPPPRDRGRAWPTRSSSSSSPASTTRWRASPAHGFRVTPFGRDATLSDRLGFSAAGGVWVKDETGNVAGSHKGRHLMGVLLHLEVAERLGLADPAARPDLAIASCGNAALAAAVVARAADRRLRVFVPVDADPVVLGGLRELGADVVDLRAHARRARRPDVRRPARRAGRRSAPVHLPGQRERPRHRGRRDPGLRDRVRPRGRGHRPRPPRRPGRRRRPGQRLHPGASTRRSSSAPSTTGPRVHTVQTTGGHPLERAYAAGPGPAARAARRRPTSTRPCTTPPRHRSAYMWPWEEEPRSIATGILDDETYDWRAVVDGMLTTGGRPLVVTEERLARAHDLGPRGRLPRRPHRLRRAGRPARPGRRRGRRPRRSRGRPVHRGRSVARRRVHPTLAGRSPREQAGSRARQRSARWWRPDGWTLPPSLALCGATVVVALDPPEVVSADVVLAGDRIAAVGTAPPGVTRRDCSGTLILPGNVCAHHHLYSALSRGMPYHLAPPVTFTEILQRVWWRLDRALDEPAIRASALRGGLDALRAGTTTIVDHHASPNAIDGSLDIIADALAELGVRSVLCYEVTDRDGPERAAAGIAENRRFLDPRDRAGARDGRARTPRSRSPTTPWPSWSRSLGRAAPACTSTSRRTPPTRSTPARGAVTVSWSGSTGPASLTDRALLAHCVHVAPRGDRLHRRRRRDGGVQPAQQHEQLGRALAVQPRAADGVALGTDGIGGDMFTESQVGYFRAREADVATPGGWPLARLADGARFAGRVHDEPLLGDAPGRAPRPTSSSSTTRRRHPVDHRQPGRPLGLRPLARARCATCTSPASWWSRTAGRRASTRRRWPPTAPARPSACGPGWTRSPRTTSSPRGADDESGAVPAGPAPHPRGHGVRPLRRGARLRGRLAGGEPTGPGGHGPDGRLRGGDEPDQGRAPAVDPDLDPQRRAARRDLLDARRARARPGDPRASAPGGSRWPARSASTGASRCGRCGRRSRPTRRLLAMERVTYHGEFVHLDDVEIDIVHGDRSPRQVPIYIGATGMQMMELAGAIADGVVLNYMVAPGVQRAGARGPDRRRGEGRTHARRHRPAPAGRVLGRPRPRPGPGPVARAAHPVPRASSPTS